MDEHRQIIDQPLIERIEMITMIKIIDQGISVAMDR